MASVETNIVIEGKGKTKQEAFTAAFSTIQSQLANQVKGLVIRIEPLEVSFLEGKEYAATEKFMFFFLKREVTKYDIKLEVKVRYFEVDVERFQFEKIQLKNTFYNSQL